MIDLPGTAFPHQNKIGPVFECSDSTLQLRCSVTDKGYPSDTFMFVWRNPQNTSLAGTGTNGDTYVIPNYTVNVSEHDGIWTCTPKNIFGHGVSATINVTLYGTFCF